MQLHKSVFVIISCFLLAVCFEEINIESKEKFLNGFVEYLNNLPDQVYMYDEGVLLNAQKTDDKNGCYHIEVRLRANAIHNVDSSGYLKCSATIQDLEENGITIQDNQYQCEDDNQVTQTSVADGDTLEDQLVVVEQTTTAAIHQPVHLDNEVQSNIGVTSGEEFVAVPRLQFGGTCTGCASHVNPEAPGVSELAALGIKQLNRHESKSKHLLEAVLDVERQVQVVNGVRYTLTLQVGFDNCTSTSSDPCFESKVCRISILEKPWIKMPDGSKYRAILSNNCSHEWTFGDEGEYIPNNESNDVDINPPINIQDKADDTPKPIPDYDKIANTGSADDILKAIHNTDLQVQIKTEKSLNEKELKDLEEQVIPYDNHKVTSEGFQHIPKSTEAANVKFHHISEFQTRKDNDHSVQYKQPEYRKSDDFLNEDRKKAIDDLINFFNSAGFDNIRDNFPRIKRSYEGELKVMSVAEKIHKIKKNISKAKYLYSLAQNMVDYLNEMDLEIKTRVLLDVIAAEEEFENHLNFFYIQARVVIPCDKAYCEGYDTQNKICNGVIETTDQERPQILSAFCYDEQKKKLKRGKTETIELNDPVLLKLTKESLKKIELESKYTNAMKIDKILQAYTRRASGRVTKITVSVLFTDCNKTVPYMKRTNCTTVQSMDSNVCEITVHERHWLKEKKITYSCNQRPIDERFSNKKNMYDVEETIKDKKVVDMTQEALQYLEMNSNKNNKQKIVHINSVTTQLIAGLLTEIKFIVGYTTCSNEFEVDLKSCELLDNQPLRTCKAQVWDRPWLEDGRQINVNCDDSIKKDNLISRRKRSQTLVGAPLTKDPNKFESLAKESLQHYLLSHNVKEIYEVVKVENVTVQLVAGTLTNIVFKVAPKNSEDKKIHCSAEVWERKWLNKKDINVSCDINGEQKRNKRQLLGGKKEQNVNELHYKLMAEESLKKFLLDTGSTQHYKILKVENVTTKVVTGSITEIDFTILPTNCELGNNKKPNISDCVVLDSANIISCHSEIWEQRWLTKIDIKVSCDINGEKKNNKLHVRGGKKEQNVNELHSQLMAEESWKSDDFLNEDRKKAIDDLIIFFNSAGFDNIRDNFPRIKRSYEGELKVMSVAEKIHKIKKNISKAKYLYSLAQNMVDYLNEMDLEIKTRVLLDVIAAEEEFENHQNFFYIQARVVIPCDKAYCEGYDTQNKICNGVIETTDQERPQILSAFCYDEQKKKLKRGKTETVELNDPVLLKLTKESLKKIELESKYTNAMKIDKILQAYTRRASGTVTKITVSVLFTDCNKTVPYMKRTNCTTVQSMDSNVCEITVHQRHWLKEKKITYSCNQRPIDERFSKKKNMFDVEETIKDKKVLDMTQEALQYLEMNSNKNNKQKIVHINSVTTQLIAGLLTEIKFIVGYTTCSNEFEVDLKSCELLDNQPLRTCKAQVWDRPWLEDGRQINVNCDDSIKKDNLISRRKRSQTLVGAPLTKDPNKFESLAKESLQHYLLSHNVKEIYEVVKVENVTVQLVAGTLTNIVFKVAPKNSEDKKIHCSAEVWERKWLNKKDINVSCDINGEQKRNKRQLLGGKKEQNVNELHYKLMAEESLKKFLLDTGSTQHYKILKVENVTTKVVTGSITEIDFTILPTNCELGNNKKPNISDCVVLDSANIISCHSEIWEQRWLTKKDIKVSCDINGEKNNNKLHVRGGKKEQNVNELHYQLMAEDSLKKFLLDTGSIQHHKILKVEKVTTQVVSGLLTAIDFIITPTNCQFNDNIDSKTSCKILDSSNIINCHSKVWEQPWLTKRNVTVKCSSKKHQNLAFIKKENTQEYSTNETDGTYLGTGKNNKRRKRSLKGKKEKQDPNLAEYKLLAQESLQKYQQRQNYQSNKSANYVVTKVVQVVRQQVSGIKFAIDFIAKPIECTQGDTQKILERKHSENDALYCHSTIWKRPWKGRNKIDIDCVRDVSEEDSEDYREKRSVSFGAPKEKDINNENYKSLAEQALAKYQELSNVENIHRIIKIHRVTEKVVAGTLIQIEYSISPTECLIEDSPISIDDCNILTPKIELLCQAKIWDRPWMTSDKNITIECKEQDSKKSKSREKKAGDNKHRNKRQVAPIEDDIDEDVRYYYADRAMSYINDKTETNNIQKLVTIHAIQNSMNMGVNMVRMYIETAFTYCIRHQDDVELAHCEELTGMYHRLCYVRLWPSPDDELVIQSIAVVCDDEPDFKSITGISKLDLIRASLKDIEASPKLKYKVIHQGEPNLIPSLDSNIPFVLSFVTVTTNCSKYIDISENPFSCFVDTNRIPRSCTSSIWMVPNSKKIKTIKTSCRPDKPYRSKRSISLESTNVTTDEKTIQNFVKESLEKLEMSSLHKYKQRVLQINSFNTKITKGRLTTIDFDVGYTSCLKYEWVENITQCEFIEHLPRRHCVSQIRERLWLNNGKQIDVNCEDDETPLEATIEFESAENAMQLAKEVLKHIEAKYPHPRKQKVVRIFSLDKQEIAGFHYRMKMEVGYTDCLALSIKDDCKLVNNVALNKFCRANVWIRPWTEHPPTYRVSCDYQDGVTTDIYHKIQAQHLFSDFLTTYKPDYIDDHVEMLKRFEIFQNNVRKIHEFNTQERGTARYAVTRFSDLTYEEFGQKYLGFKPNLRDNNQIPIRKADIPQVHLPDAFDWRQYDAVTEVKDQGACGSCWAFSVTGNIEGQWKMQSGELVSLSEQELVDCDSLDQGCNGGLPDNAYRAIEQLGGLEAENDYPYEGENDKCAFNKTLSRVQISGAVNISSNETDMAKWLVQNGPISIGINANAMQFYVGGVSHPWRMLCSPSKLDHGVLVVGYGVKDYPLFNKRLPYWIIKNSWGKRWGEQGYYRVYRGDGTCGVNQMASSAVI